MRTPRLEKDPMVPLTILIPAGLKRRLEDDAYAGRKSVGFLVRRILGDTVPYVRGDRIAPAQPNYIPPLEPILEVLD